MCCRAAIGILLMHHARQGGWDSESGLVTCTHDTTLSKQRASQVKPAQVLPPPVLPFQILNHFFSRLNLDTENHKPLAQIAVKHTSSALDEEYILQPREPGMSFFRKSSSRGDKPEAKAEPEKTSATALQTAPKPGPGSEFPFEERMRARYHDSAKLKTSLDSIYGQGNYKVKERANRFILMLPKPLKKDELAAIEQRIRVHYHD
ncbi:uncharacterized protein BDZ83DRAFT_62946 [Colletotrichum acutatum]|uniref:Uncharacterized protein n=1 Tax=Glomerella acutata TaxID=27357 RepID=A0AAD8U9N0_GLOAC|nr:uncharacterized protein BDZ83DRAFT_62946 [Colletotrichum acutatum]KAK1714929.1 hypothetical protein BDZ83DRAFT_62946 [Colletotrichum acutatum]